MSSTSSAESTTPQQIVLDCIQPKDTLIVRNAVDKSCYILKVNGDQKLGKSRVSLKDIVHQPYSMTYELNGRKFQKVSNGKEDLNVDEIGGNTGDSLVNKYSTSIQEKRSSAQNTVVRGDNSRYIDTNTAQKLDQNDIQKLRNQGLSGEEIIKHLIENSDTTAFKTDFAIAKWLKRKEMKYLKQYEVLKSTPATLCEACFGRNKEKMCNMRYDVLAQILNQANIHAGLRVMVIESTCGFMTGSVAYRMRGHGRLLSVYGGQQAHMEMAKQLNLDANSIEIIQPLPAIELGPAARDIAQNGFTDEEDIAPEYPVLTPEDVAALQQQHKEEMESSKGTESSAKGNPKKRKLHTVVGQDQLNSTGRSLSSAPRVHEYLRQGVDSLIIASKFRPLPILKVALYCLAPSSPFVLYHEFFEPLVDCFNYLSDSGLAIRMVLADSWLREFQALPGRFRPEMFTSTSGGYILYGIYVGMVPRPFLPSNESSGNTKGKRNTEDENAKDTEQVLMDEEEDNDQDEGK